MDLENLPYREPMKRKYRWSRRFRFSNHRVDGVYVWRIARRVFHNNIGKSFDMAFHYYCKQVPKHQQHLFLEQIILRPDHWIRFYPGYYVDNQNNIQLRRRKKVKPVYKVYSEDYKLKWIHKKFKFVSYIRPYYAAEDEYIQTYDGTVLEYNSKSHPEYIKYVRKLLRKRKLDKKLQKQRELEIFYEGLQKSNNLS